MIADSMAWWTLCFALLSVISYLALREWQMRNIGLAAFYAVLAAALFATMALVVRS